MTRLFSVICDLLIFNLKSVIYDTMRFQFSVTCDQTPFLKWEIKVLLGPDSAVSDQVIAGSKDYSERPRDERGDNGSQLLITGTWAYSGWSSNWDPTLQWEIKVLVGPESAVSDQVHVRKTTVRDEVITGTHCYRERPSNYSELSLQWQIE